MKKLLTNVLNRLGLYTNKQFLELLIECESKDVTIEHLRVHVQEWYPEKFRQQKERIEELEKKLSKYESEG